MAYDGCYKYYEDEILKCYRAGNNASQIWSHIYRGKGGGHWRWSIPTMTMIRYILKRNGLISPSRHNPKALDKRIANCLLNERLTLVEAQAMSDAELLRIPNFGFRSLNRIRGPSPAAVPQNPDYRFEHLSEAPIG